jgi:uncharacterized protein (DUF736 family)
MPVIGMFAPAADGYTGTVRTLTLNGSVNFVTHDHKAGDSAPDFKITLGDIEIGAAWRKTKQGSDQTYLRVRLDDPAWSHPIWAIMPEVAADGVLSLMWRRPRRSED